METLIFHFRFPKGNKPFKCLIPEQQTTTDSKNSKPKSFLERFTN